jgi:hypothetical protein
MPYLEIISLPTPAGDESVEPAIFRGEPRELTVGARFELDGNEIRVGRDVASDLRIRLITVARYCFRIYRSGEHDVFEDGRARRPIYNDEPLAESSKVIADGDTFGAGGVFFR